MKNLSEPIKNIIGMHAIALYIVGVILASKAIASLL